MQVILETLLEEKRSKTLLLSSLLSIKEVRQGNRWLQIRNRKTKLQNMFRLEKNLASHSLRCIYTERGIQMKGQSNLISTHRFASWWLPKQFSFPTFFLKNSMDIFCIYSEHERVFGSQMSLADSSIKPNSMCQSRPTTRNEKVHTCSPDKVVFGKL